MKKLIRAGGAVLAAALLLTGCASTAVKVPKLALETPMDDTIPAMTAEHTGELNKNPDRGYRMEMYYTLGSGCSWPGGNDDGYKTMAEILGRFIEEDPHEIQTYIYLTEYYDRDLDDKAFDQLKEFFETLREKNLYSILRFAYEPDQNSDLAPTEEQLLRHTAQLKAWMSENETLLKDTVTVFQMGIIGAWGEWGGSNQKYDRKKVANAIADMVPKSIYINGRYTTVTKQVKGENADRVGYHNDFMVGRPHPWNTAYDKNYAPDYLTFAKKAPYQMNDGEMPWVSVTGEPDEYVDGKKFLQQCFEHRLATFSIEHNYKETAKVAKRPEDYNIARWKTEAFTEADAKELGLPYYSAWFQNEDGTAAQRTIYEYLENFLGYHLTASNLKIEGNKISFLLTNMGFGAPLTLGKAELVVRGADGAESRYPLTGFDPSKMATYQQCALQAEVKEDLSGCSFGIAVLRERSVGDVPIRLANNVPFEDGVNWLRVV